MRHPTPRRHRTNPRRPSFIQNEVREASGGGHAGDHAGGQVAQSGQQHVVQSAQVQQPHRQVGPVRVQEGSGDRNRLADDQGARDGRPRRNRSSADRENLRDRSFFFGDNSPFDNALSAAIASSASNSSTSTTNTFLLFPWLLTGYGFGATGYGFFGLGYGWGGYGTSYGPPYVYDDRPILAPARIAAISTQNGIDAPRRRRIAG